MKRAKAIIITIVLIMTEALINQGFQNPPGVHKSLITTAISESAKESEDSEMSKTTDRQIVNGETYLIVDTGAREAISAEATAREAAVSAEATAREAAVSAEATAREAAVSAEATAREAAVSAEATAREKNVADLESAINTKNRAWNAKWDITPNGYYSYVYIETIIQKNTKLTASWANFSGDETPDVAIVGVKQDGTTTARLYTLENESEVYEFIYTGNDTLKGINVIFHTAAYYSEIVETADILFINWGYGEELYLSNNRPKWWQKEYYGTTVHNSQYPYYDITDITPDKDYVFCLKEYSGTQQQEIWVSSFDALSEQTILVRPITIGSLYYIHIPSNAIKLRIIIRISGDEYDKSLTYWLYKLDDDMAFYKIIADAIISDQGMQKFKTYAILGDSWSTFKGYTDPLSNTQWYPASDPECQGYNTGNNVVSVSQTWWHKLSTDQKMLLVENRSFSGSPICYDGYGDGSADAKEKSFVTRVQGMTRNAELIIIEGGINDSSAGAAVGEYKYSNWEDDDFKTFRPALAFVIDYLQKHNAGAVIVFMKANGLRNEISESITEICEHYNVPVLYLGDIDVTASHPNSTGMQEIFEITKAFIQDL